MLHTDSPIVSTIQVISCSRHAQSLEVARLVRTQCFDLPILKRNLV